MQTPPNHRTHTTEGDLYRVQRDHGVSEIESGFSPIVEWQASCQPNPHVFHALLIGLLSPDTREANNNKEYTWWLHRFKHKASRTEGPTEAKVNAYNVKLHKSPTPASYRQYLDMNGTKQCESIDADRFNIWNIMTSAPVSTVILDGINSSVINSEQQLMGE